MGLFDKLFSKEVMSKIEEVQKKAEEAIGGAIDKILPDEKKAEEAVQQAQNAAEQVQDTAGQAQTAAQNAVSAAKEQFEILADAVGSEIENRGSAAYFKEVIEKNLSGTEVKCGVSLEEIGVSEPKRNEPPTAVVYKDGAPAAVLYIVKKNSYRRECYTFAMAACKAAGIPALRFMEEFRNDPGYVAGRVDAVLK
ncbi:MAG: hypothetical protein J6Z38_00715 [Lachnospiraceae bacterium]|nr:hypothetical protein [Lachnospiraceae bacterium]